MNLAGLALVESSSVCSPHLMVGDMLIESRSCSHFLAESSVVSNLGFSVLGRQDPRVGSQSCNLCELSERGQQESLSVFPIFLHSLSPLPAPSPLQASSQLNNRCLSYPQPAPQHLPPSHLTDPQCTGTPAHPPPELLPYFPSLPFPSHNHLTSLPTSLLSAYPLLTNPSSQHCPH